MNYLKGDTTSKKGAFQLSMSLVVVIIMSIVLLGLGIKWITGTVKNIEGLTHQVTDTAKGNLLKDLSSSNKKVAVTAPGLIRWKPGESGSFALGVRNDDTINRRAFVDRVVLIEYPEGTKTDKIYYSKEDHMVIDSLGADSRDITVRFESKSEKDIPRGVYKFGVTVCRIGDEGVNSVSDCPTYDQLDNQDAWTKIYDATTFSIEIDPFA